MLARHDWGREGMLDKEEEDRQQLAQETMGLQLDENDLRTEDDEELEVDEEYDYYEDENNNEVVVGTASTSDNPLEALLADARKMREKEEQNSPAEEEESISNSIFGKS